MPPESSLTIEGRGGIIDMGGDDMVFIGAGGAIPRADLNRMDEHAERYYEEIRKRTSDVDVIAQNTGFSIAEIKIVKNHVFFNKYELDGKEVKRFDPSYDMAVSWQRLIDGKNIEEMDIVMLKHELLEYDLMRNKGMDYYEAHILADKEYSYSKFTRELDAKEGVL